MTLRQEGGREGGTSDAPLRPHQNMEYNPIELTYAALSIENSRTHFVSQCEELTRSLLLCHGLRPRGVQNFLIPWDDAHLIVVHDSLSYKANAPYCVGDSVAEFAALALDDLIRLLDTWIAICIAEGDEKRSAES